MVLLCAPHRVRVLLQSRLLGSVLPLARILLANTQCLAVLDELLPISRLDVRAMAQIATTGSMSSIALPLLRTVIARAGPVVVPNEHCQETPSVVDQFGLVVQETRRHSCSSRHPKCFFSAHHRHLLFLLKPQFVTSGFRLHASANHSDPRSLESSNTPSLCRHLFLP